METVVAEVSRLQQAIEHAQWLLKLAHVSVETRQAMYCASLRLDDLAEYGRADERFAAAVDELNRRTAAMLAFMASLQAAS